MDEKGLNNITKEFENDTAGDSYLMRIKENQITMEKFKNANLNGYDCK